MTTKPTRPGGANAPALPLRRAFLGTVASVAAGTAAVAEMSVHPDAELLALGAEYESLIAASYDWPDNSSMPEEMWGRFYEVEDRVTALEPQTLEGLAVKLRLLWCWHIEDRTEHRYGATDDSDKRTKMFWGILQTVKAMSRGA